MCKLVSMHHLKVISMKKAENEDESEILHQSEDAEEEEEDEEN